MATSRLLHFLRQLRSRHTCIVHDRVVREDRLRRVVVDENLDAEDARPNDDGGNEHVRLYGGDLSCQSENSEISIDDHRRLCRVLDTVHWRDVDRHLFQRSPSHSIVARRRSANDLSAAERPQSSDLHDIQPSTEVIIVVVGHRAHVDSYGLEKVASGAATFDVDLVELDRADVAQNQRTSPRQSGPARSHSNLDELTVDESILTVASI